MKFLLIIIINIKNKDTKFNNICLVKRMKSINSKKYKNIKYLDGSNNKRIINNRDNDNNFHKKKRYKI